MSERRAPYRIPHQTQVQAQTSDVLLLCGRNLDALAIRAAAGDLVDVVVVRSRDLVLPSGQDDSRWHALFARYICILLLPDDAVTEPIGGMTRRARRLTFPAWLGEGKGLEDVVAQGGPGVLRYWVGLAVADVIPVPPPPPPSGHMVDGAC